jgi:quinol monooxygenase YgiN
MYGTVAHLRVKADHGEALRHLMEEWNTDRKPNVRGALTGYLYQLDRDPQDWIMVALFQDKDFYRANAEDPAQDLWFRQFMEHLEQEPQWHDGEAFAI